MIDLKSIDILLRLHALKRMMQHSALVFIFISGSIHAAVIPKTLSTTTIHTQQKTHDHVVVLIHGLMRTYRSMNTLRISLERAGYQVYLYRYPSYQKTIHEHSLALNQFLSSLLAQNKNTHIDVVTHSLGGIIAREAIAQLSKQQLKRMGHLVMLAPPNQGSKQAQFAVTVFPFIKYFIKPLAELTPNRAAYVHHVPIPNIKIGIIAGRYDAKVPPQATWLSKRSETAIVNSTHTFIMNNSETQILVLRFLKKDSFSDRKKIVRA